MVSLLHRIATFSRLVGRSSCVCYWNKSREMLMQRGWLVNYRRPRLKKLTLFLPLYKSSTWLRFIIMSNYKIRKSFLLSTKSGAIKDTKRNVLSIKILQNHRPQKKRKKRKENQSWMGKLMLPAKLEQGMSISCRSFQWKKRVTVADIFTMNLEETLYELI